MSVAALRALIDVTRGQWGAQPFPRSHTTVDVHPYVEVHHSVTPTLWDGLRHAKAIESNHLGRGWNGPFYTLGVDRDGRVWELRGPGRRSIGSHTATYWNTPGGGDGTPVDPRAATVVLFGEYHVDDPTLPQLAAVARLAESVPDGRLRWHRMRAYTQCPGGNTIPRLVAWNNRPTGDEESEIMGAAEDVRWIKDCLIDQFPANGDRGHNHAYAIQSTNGAVQAMRAQLAQALGDTSQIRKAIEATGSDLGRLSVIEALVRDLVAAVDGIPAADGSAPPLTEAEFIGLLIKTLQQLVAD